jgi:hypothetical protein
MPTDVLPLQNLAQRIQQQEAELARLRQEFETRQAQLTDLSRRKKDLQAQLQKVEAEIQAAGQVGEGKPTSVLTQTVNKKPAATKPPARKRTKGASLANYLINCVRQAKRPITTKELADEAVRSKYPTTSSNLRGMVETRVGELVRKGVLRRAAGQSGVVLGTAPASAKPIAMQASSVAARNGQKTQTAKPTAPTKPTEAKKKRSLLDVLTQVLTKSSRPLPTEELVKQVLATGYQTKSQDFKNVIWVAIGNLPNVERIPDQGYRLKNRKISGKKS